MAKAWESRRRVKPKLIITFSKININKISHLTNILYFLQGVIFSLNARNSRQEHISLELKEGRLELVHSLPNGSNIIDIPAKISDGKWHQLAIR